MFSNASVFEVWSDIFSFGQNDYADLRAMCANPVLMFLSILRTFDRNQIKA